ncbi:MAG: peptide ABC transporter [Acidimicrobiaceae bacterium]|nr:peptide ABC transporter [Acidimicrobiaceae bacterium]
MNPAVSRTLRRVPRLVLTLLAVSFCTFLLTNLLPGDPALTILGENASDEQIEALRADLRLDDPILVRYVAWLGDALTGDLGTSYRTGQSVTDAIIERLPVTLELGIVSLALSLIVAIPLGVWSAYRAGGLVDRFLTTASFGLMAVPGFMLALFLIIVFAVRLGWLPSTGWVRFSEDPVGNIRSVILPAIALGANEIAVFMRVLRSDMLTTLNQDSITMARAKGLSAGRILTFHALRPSSLSLVTIIGVQIGAIIGGSVIIETMFALPGVGRLLIDSIAERDLVTVQGLALVIGVSVIVVNFITDSIYGFIDPRIRDGRNA